MQMMYIRIAVLAALALLGLPTANAHDGEIVQCVLDLDDCLREP